MAWVKIDDQFYDHPKFAETGALGIALWACGLAYCNKHLTDGRIPRGQVGRFCDLEGADPHAVAARLVNAGLWDDDGTAYWVHDYHDHQPSADTIKAKREKERERWQRRNGSTTDSAPPPRGVAPDSEVGTATAPQVPEPVPVPVTPLAPAEPLQEYDRTDPLYEALLLACGIDTVTSSAHGAYRRATSEIRALDGTPDQVFDRAKRHSKRWPNASLTPSSVARHWGELGPPPPVASPYKDWESDGLVYGGSRKDTA